MVCVPHLIVGLIMSDVFVPKLSTPLEDTNRLECVGLCHRNITCSSFFFNQDFKLCYLQTRWMKKFEKSDTPNGMHYFEMNTDPCSGTGYQFVRKGPMCLRFSTDMEVSKTAEDRCKSEEARLVKIDTEKKNEAVMEILENDYSNTFFHIGAGIPTGKKQFEWIDGSALSYTSWAANEPKTNEQYCVRINWKDSEHGWYAGKCTDKFKYICEKVLL